MRAVLGVATCAVACGCFAKPERLAAAIDAPMSDTSIDAKTFTDAYLPCSGTFSTPTSLPELEGHVTGEPALRSNLLEMFWAFQRDGTHWEIDYADRLQVNQQFTVHGKEPFGDAPFDQDPAITDDGNLLVFRTVGAGSEPVLGQVIRTGTTWGTPTAVPGLAGEPVASLDISPDGLTLYFNDLGDHLHIATRPNRSADFVKSATEFGTGLSFPSVSADGLELFYTANGTSRTTRSSLLQAFQLGTPLIPTDFDPDITSDGRTLVMGNGIGVSITQRACP